MQTVHVQNYENHNEQNDAERLKNQRTSFHPCDVIFGTLQFLPKTKLVLPCMWQWVLITAH